MSQVPSTSSSREPVPACFPEDAPPAATSSAPPSPEAAKPQAAKPQVPNTQVPKTQAPKTQAEKAQTSTAQAEKAQAASPSSVQPFRDNDVNRSWVGAGLEDATRLALEQLPPGGTAELGLEGTLRLELAGEAAGKLKVKREKDGSYSVTVQSRAGAGVGAGVGLASSNKGGTVDGSAMAGLSGALTLRFASAAEAADRLSALAQRPNPSDMLGRGLVAMGVLDADATERSLAALASTSRFEVGVYGQLKAKLDATIAKLGAKSTGEARMRVDIERGTVSFEMSRDVSLTAKAHLPELKLGAVKLAPTATSAQAQLALQQTVRVETRLRPGELERLLRGDLDPTQLMQPERLQVTLVQKRELDVQGVQVQAQRTFDLGGGVPPEALDPEQGLWEVSAGIDGGAGGELGFRTGALDLKAELKVEVPLFSSGPVRLPFKDVEGAVLSRLQEHHREEALVHAQLAASR